MFVIAQEDTVPVQFASLKRECFDSFAPKHFHHLKMDCFAVDGISL